ncbi:MAG TPA: elongation factor P [Marinilabiliales bacterium]|jgi:elongation factor P|nr:elongation factor P [Salinivirgaceae bacterium]OFX39831.1 MAG: elongation factor P [Bacteroidetes bacterium GWA2_40_14]OFX59872.1 MAG: elongation factor P [Bacteroidetes bacterium GWC2_40_13]OFX75095.1 MAG: elongation factor P [Bacteroidetes bacterium GWD2_40_43]OFX93856.1 MAG: elongation factor P [Bacteroidetes bacterium GWE2_40_63]OFY18071.1 MAG: elongation factor P [Bacteroidetes bacterium GWF2_40_13]OFZ27316.1 MAG: elongation factor P [Bacteroidetes bacterium RIFOXYC2_FULL_40_12]HAM98
MADTSDFRNGLCIEYNGKLYTIVSFQHVKPGKGPAFVRTKLRNLETGKVVDNTFTSGVKITTVRIERRPYQFLYKDEVGYNFMNNETFEQISIPESLIEAYDLLKEGQNVEIVFHAEKETPLQVDLPPFVEMEVTYSEPGIKGDTATNTLKQATIETGAIIMVPLFINTGDRIKVDTRDKSYSERVKN